MAKAIKTATKRKVASKTIKTVKATKRPARKTSAVRAKSVKTIKAVAKPAARRAAGRPAARKTVRKAR
jgi:hypothetical protein